MAVQNQLANKGQQRLGLTAYLTQDAVKNQINSVVGGQDGQKFIASVVSAVQANPLVQECTNQSILSAALLGQSLKLSPSPHLGHFYMVPFNNSKEGYKEAQFQLGYKGYVQLAERSGYYKRLNVIAIKEGELVKYDPLEEDIEVNLIEDDEVREETPTIGYYAFFEYLNGFRKSLYWSRKKMEAHAKKYSQGFRRDLEKGTAYTFWSKDFDGMAFKTMLRQLISKWGIMSIEMQTAMAADMSVIRDEGQTFDYVDNQPDIVADIPADTVTGGISEEAQPTVENKPKRKKSGQTAATEPSNEVTGVQEALFGSMEG